MNTTIIRRWLPLIMLIGLLVLFFTFRLNKYFNFEMLQENRTLLISWTKSHYLSASVLFVACYIFSVAISFPGAVYLTLVGGFLFGIFWGAVFVVLSATIGSTLLFFCCAHFFGGLVGSKSIGLGRTNA